MRENRPDITERVGSALSRGDLRQRETMCDLDTITALGLVGVSERLADTVYRLKYANDYKSYNDAFDGVYRLARVLDVRLRWRSRRSGLRRMVTRVLGYWLNDVCFTCTGLGYEVARGSPHLSDRACKACHGTKKRPMPWLIRLPRRPEGRRGSRDRVKRWSAKVERINEIMSRHRRLLVELEVSERAIAEKMISKLSREKRAA